jgi:Protein of unknown function (DUF3306)
MADSILGRWSQRKQAVREGKPLDEPVRVVPASVPATAPVTAFTANTAAATQITPASEPPQTLPPPTLQDVQALTPESDFSAFTGVNVSPEVSNAAMKKLFTDPHYNVMDGLDIYIDDYSKPDPLPLSMLRQMASAQFLNLFDEEKEGNAVATVPHNPATSIQSEEDAAIAHVKTQDHAHPDLRLQPNDAAGAQDAGRGTE